MENVAKHILKGSINNKAGNLVISKYIYEIFAPYIAIFILLNMVYITLLIIIIYIMHNVSINTSPA
jgi:hypothetical protein